MQRNSTPFFVYFNHIRNQPTPRNLLDITHTAGIHLTIIFIDIVPIEF